MTTKWTYEACRKEASNFLSLNEWNLGHHKSYFAAYQKKWQRQIGSELGWYMAAYEKDSGVSYEECLKSAMPYDTLKEWKAAAPEYHQRCAKKNWIKKIRMARGWGLRTTIKDYSYEKCKGFAKNYKTLKDWRLNHVQSYRYALLLGVKDRITDEMGWAKNKGGRRQSVKEVHLTTASLSKKRNQPIKMPELKTHYLLDTIVAPGETVVFKGDEFKCDSCKGVALIAANDIIYGTPPRSSDYTYPDGRKLGVGSRMVCCLCGYNYSDISLTGKVLE